MSSLNDLRMSMQAREYVTGVQMKTCDAREDFTVIYLWKLTNLDIKIIVFIR